MKNKLEISLDRNVISVDSIDKYISVLDRVQSYLVYYCNDAFFQLVSEVYFTLQILKDFFTEIETCKAKIKDLISNLLEVQSIGTFINNLDLVQSLIVTNCKEILSVVPEIYYYLQNIKEFFKENTKYVLV